MANTSKTQTPREMLRQKVAEAEPGTRNWYYWSLGALYADFIKAHGVEAALEDHEALGEGLQRTKDHTDNMFTERGL